MSRENLIQTARGKKAADLVLKNANIFNVFTGEFLPGDISVTEGIIAGIGQYDAAEEIVDVSGKYIVPGFINAHCHVESSMVTPDIYIREELRWGTTTLITDPHEVANISGIDSIRFMMETARDLPVNYYVQVPSCVPATPFENSGAVLDNNDICNLLNDQMVLGLGEMMNYPGVLSADEAVMQKLAAGKDRIIDGHAPLLTGMDLQAYAAAGISTDHESVSFEEAREKVRAGMAVLVREGSACKNLNEIITGVVKNKLDTRRMAFCTDDKHITDIRRDGTIRYCILLSIRLGLEPAAAFRMASYNAARIYGLKRLGAIAPGYRADLVVLDGLNTLNISLVYKDGKTVDFHRFKKALPKDLGRNSVNIAALKPDCFRLPKPKDGIYPVVEIVNKQITTKKSYIKQEYVEQALMCGELCKLAVIERHHATGNIGLGLLSGYGLKNGAIASTVAHDSHNLIAAGTNDNDMLMAVQEIKHIRGGYVFIQNGKVIECVPLPIYGLMNDGEPDWLINKLENLTNLLYKAGINPEIDPFITLSFLALPVIPEIRVTDKGVFDVVNFRFYN